MKKRVLVLLVFYLLAIYLSGCDRGQGDIKHFKHDENANENEIALYEEIERLRDGIATMSAERDCDTDKETGDSSDVVGRLQSGAAEGKPSVTTAPLPTPAPTPVATPKPALAPTPAPVSTPKPTQASEQDILKTPVQIPEPPPTPMPETAPKPEPAPTPTPAPQPTPAPTVVVTPPPARTICNTCGADITDNLTAHGTEHLLNGENFSYRNE